ncbi:MAG: S-layer homology domain-containing protein [Clostridia bacterium]|nr:S-layer homology domain-containing protein [Clostridia bacterium]
MKKLICIVLALSIVAMCVPAMAATTTFSDVTESSKYKTAIYTLNDFGIILGDAGSDTFRPQANISREEFSVIMTRVLGLGALNVSVTDYPFPDVIPSTSADWSIKATKIAYDLGIIKGFEDGTFRPKEKVTFEQAVKMIVCTLGYEASALNQGGWPTGYITVARGFGILNNAETAHSEPASREIIAQLIANSLEVPLADTEVSANRTLLSEKLKYTESTGVVTGIYGKALKSNATGIEEDEVQVDYNKKFKVGNTSAKEYFGKEIKYYYNNDGANNILVSARLTNRNSEVTVSSDQIKELYATKLEYYPNSDNASTYETYAFESSSVSGIYNGKYVSEITQSLKPDSGSITLIDNNGNGMYDVVIIDSSEVYVVSAVDTAKKIVYNAYNQAQSLNLSEGSQIDVTITKSGSEVEFSQIKKGDVLLVSASLSPIGRQAYNVEIVTNSVSGNVTSMSSSKDDVTILGKTYEYSNAYSRYITNMPSEAMNVGDKVTVYLDSNDKILAASVTSIATTTKYGYLIATDALSKNEYARFKIYTTDNKTLTLNGTEKVKINGTAYSYDSVEGALAAANSATNKDSGATNTTVAQLIEYTTNSNGKIDNIYTIQTSGDTEKALVLSKSFQNDVAYTSSSKKLGSDVILTSSTKVMFVPSNRSDTSSYSVGTYSKLKNQSKYDFEAYDSSTTGVPKVVIVYGDSGLIGIDDPTVTFALIESIKDTVDTSTGAAVTTVTCKVDGASKTYKCEDPSRLSGYGKGDVLRIAFDAKGYIKEVASAFDIDNLPAEGKSNRVYTKSESSNYFKTIFGTVYARDEFNNILITPYDVAEDNSLSLTDKETVKVSTNTKIYVLNTAVVENSENRLTEGTIDSIAGYEISQSGASQVFAYLRGSGETALKFILVVSK